MPQARFDSDGENPDEGGGYHRISAYYFRYSGNRPRTFPQVRQRATKG